jgi:hypothetical protein
VYFKILKYTECFILITNIHIHVFKLGSGLQRVLKQCGVNSHTAYPSLLNEDIKCIYNGTFKMTKSTRCCSALMNSENAPLVLHLDGELIEETTYIPVGSHKIHPT